MLFPTISLIYASKLIMTRSLTPPKTRWLEHVSSAFRLFADNVSPFLLLMLPTLNFKLRVPASSRTSTSIGASFPTMCPPSQRNYLAFLKLSLWYTKERLANFPLSPMLFMSGSFFPPRLQCTPPPLNDSPSPLERKF